MRNHSGEVPEWLNGAVSKTVVARKGYRGFESHPLRYFEGQRDTQRWLSVFDFTPIGLIAVPSPCKGLMLLGW